MVWTGDASHRFAPALLTLWRQLTARWPGQQWQTSPQTGTKADERHQSEGSASDHNYWLANTVRALDVAANVSGVAGIVTVTDAPDCEALFEMVNKMYADRDPRVWPDGYAIFNRRVTDWNNPGGYHAQQGDPHLYHLHISTSRNPAGYNSTAPWPLPGAGQEDTLSAAEVAEIKAAIGAQSAADREWFHKELSGTMNRVKAIAAGVGSVTELPARIAAEVAKLPAGGLVDPNTIDSIAQAVLTGMAQRLDTDPESPA